MNEFTGEAIKDSALLNMAARVKTVIDPSLNSMEHSTVRIKTRRGEFETTMLHPYGSTGNPMTFEDVAKKFLNYAANTVKPIPEQNKRTVIDMVKNLEEVKDVTEIIRLLA